MKKFNPKTGLWSLIEGGIMEGIHDRKITLSEDATLRKKEIAKGMISDFLDRNPDKKDEFLKEWGDVILL